MLLASVLVNMLLPLNMLVRELILSPKILIGRYPNHCNFSHITTVFTIVLLSKTALLKGIYTFFELDGNGIDIRTDSFGIVTQSSSVRLG